MHGNELELLLRIAIACVLGFAIGHERRNRNKSAGIRTHAIVAMGSALMMVVSKYGFADVADYDASRVAAQIVSGIGFLGAGLYVISIASAGMIIIAQEITHRVSYFAQAACGGNLRLTLVQKEGVIMMMENFLKGYKVDIAAVKIHKNKKDEIKVEFEVVYPPGFDKAGLISHLAENENVVTILE